MTALDIEMFETFFPPNKIGCTTYNLNVQSRILKVRHIDLHTTKLPQDGFGCTRCSDAVVGNFWPRMSQECVGCLATMQLRSHQRLTASHISCLPVSYSWNDRIQWSFAALCSYLLLYINISTVANNHINFSIWVRII